MQRPEVNPLRVMMRLGGPFEAFMSWRVPCNLGVVRCADGSMSLSMFGRLEGQRGGAPAVSVELQLTQDEATGLRRDLKGAGIRYRDPYPDLALYRTSYEVWATPYPDDAAD